MKKLLLFAAALLLLGTTLSLADMAQNTPAVRYVYPRNDSKVDLRKEEGDEEEKTVRFRWKSSPVPGGGRSAYKFELYKDFSYEAMLREEFGPYTYGLEVPADKFENGSVYTWQVKQRDEKTRKWNKDNRWSFKIIK